MQHVRLQRTLLTSVIVSVVAHLVSAAPARSEAQALFDLTSDLVKSAQTQQADVTLVGGARPALRLQSTAAGEASVTITPPAEWDLSARESIKLTVRNTGDAPSTVRVRAENADAKGLMDSCLAATEVLPGETRDLTLRLTRRPEDLGYDVFKPFYMYFKNINVRDNTIDPAHVARLVISSDSTKPGTIEISDVQTVGAGKPAPAPFMPFVDEYGQYMHSDWPGKIHTDSDFKTLRDEETKERADWPQPKSWDKWGGWADGPTLKATGFFYAAKHEGKWWFVDPDGKLFWSYGPTGVGFGGDVSPFTERENWFAALPKHDSPLARFYHSERDATYMFYKDKDWRGYDMQAANLFRKYGEKYQDDVAQISHDRLHSWGFNTIANWSSPQIYGLHKTPYTVAIHYGDVSVMKWNDGHSFQDVYDPAWEPAVYARMEQERGKTAGDPWCIGYFVDNERCVGWRPRAAAVGEIALKAKPDQPAKAKFIGLLKQKYPTIGALNTAWKTQYASWDALREARDMPSFKDNDTLLSDCGDFGMMFCERYFSVCRAAVKSVAPNNLFLGSRFYGHTDTAVVELAGKYWDVISYNIYDNPPTGRVNQLNKLDLPVLSTEWGIGSDPLQTPFRGKDLATQTPTERANEMAKYSEIALRHPNMVGAHFFQFRDQPLSGRPDGEATLRGFVNIADTPNFELVQANRRVAYTLYEKRSAAK